MLELVSTGCEQHKSSKWSCFSFLLTRISVYTLFNTHLNETQGNSKSVTNSENLPFTDERVHFVLNAPFSNHYYF